MEDRYERCERRLAKCTKCATFNNSEGKCNMSLREAITCRAYENELFKTKKKETNK